MPLQWASEHNTITILVGRCSIVDMVSAYGVKGPGFTSQWRKQFIKFINVCSVQLDENKAPIGANL